MPASNAGSSTIVQPVGSQSKPTILTRALQGLRKTFFTGSDLQNPQQLHKVLTDLQTNTALAVKPLAENPLLSGTRVAGVAFTSGQTRTLNHGLGRAYQGYHTVNDSGVNWTGFVANNPSGVSKDQCITLTSPTTGTWDFWVF